MIKSLAKHFEKVNVLAAKNGLAVAFSACVLVASPAQAGIPVIDGGNLTQNIISAIESVAQTMTQLDQYAQQIEQYQTQLQQYENQLQNTAAPAAYIWDQAQRTMQRLVEAQNSLAYYQNRLGSLDNYLSKFQDVAYYRSSPCFNGTGGCTQSEWEAMEENRRLASESQKKANDSLFKTIADQQQAMQDDARTLERLQGAAQGADGQMQALGFANQLASQQANQLLQIRSMMNAQHAVLAAKAQADTDRQAVERAAHEQLYKGLETPVNRSKSKEF
ncbi:MAG: P-type conjugative transfer protein TrbJ [Thiopseudomonas sp.]|nr:P-type conjugative transfer protein TrbJ [Thiopseudomonas sp.]MCK9466483.1 P-type conjugative transfer protein TrbJ [Thiopseudomonas sp.]